LKLSSPYFYDILITKTSAAGAAVDEYSQKVPLNQRWKVLWAVVGQYKTTGTLTQLKVEAAEATFTYGTTPRTGNKSVSLIDRTAANTSDINTFPRNDANTTRVEHSGATDVFLKSGERFRLQVALTAAEVTEVYAYIRVMVWDEIGK